jgi:hypothetical protein
MEEEKSFFSKLVERFKKSREERKIRKSKTYNGAALIDPLKPSHVHQGEFDDFSNRLDNDSLIVLVFGKRGSGKSSLGFRLLENIYGKTKRYCFALGIEKKLLPKWINPIDDVEIAPNGSVILVDEGAIAFSSRDSMKFKNKELGKLLAIARHKDLTIIFVTQNTGLIDRNVLKLADTLFIKEGSLLQLEMERTEIKKFYEKSKKQLDKFKDKKKYSYVIDSDFEGLVEHSLPSFWSESLSKNKVK